MASLVLAAHIRMLYVFEYRWVTFLISFVHGSVAVGLALSVNPDSLEFAHLHLPIIESNTSGCLLHLLRRSQVLLVHGLSFGSCTD